MGATAAIVYSLYMVPVETSSVWTAMKAHVSFARKLSEGTLIAMIDDRELAPILINMALRLFDVRQ